jgi:hypothetical protein
MDAASTAAADSMAADSTAVVDSMAAECRVAAVRVVARKADTVLPLRFVQNRLPVPRCKAVVSPSAPQYTVVAARPAALQCTAREA